MGRKHTHTWPSHLAEYDDDDDDDDDSHIQRIVLATEETTVTQQEVNHRPNQMPIPLVVTKRYEGQRVTSW